MKNSNGSFKMTEKYYCKRSRHPHPEHIRVDDEKLWQQVINCPMICCIRCSFKENCKFACWLANHDHGSCPDQCTIQEKVYGEILEKTEEDPMEF